MFAMQFVGTMPAMIEIAGLLWLILGSYVDVWWSGHLQIRSMMLFLDVAPRKIGWLRSTPTRPNKRECTQHKCAFGCSHTAAPIGRRSFNSTTGSPGTVIQTHYTCQKWRPTAYRWPPSHGRLQMAT